MMVCLWHGAGSERGRMVGRAGGSRIGGRDGPVTVGDTG
jgi:hypothetical protein